MSGITEERRLLKRYRAEYAEAQEAEKQIIKKRIALYNAIAGLEALLKLSGGAEEEDAEETPPSQIEKAPRTRSETSKLAQTIADAAIEVLRSRNGQAMSAKDIEKALAAADNPINYYTLYRTLTRETEGEAPRLAREHGKFSLLG